MYLEKYTIIRNEENGTMFSELKVENNGIEMKCFLPVDKEIMERLNVLCEEVIRRASDK